MANDRDSQQYQDDYQRGLDRISDVRRNQMVSRVTQWSGEPDSSEPSNGSTYLHSPLVSLTLSAPTLTPATTTAANDQDRRYTEDYLQAQAAIEAHKNSISPPSNTEVSDRNRPAATATPTATLTLYHGHANGGARARAKEEEEEDRSRLLNLGLFNHDHDDDGIRHRNPHRNPASHGDQGEAPPHPPTAQPTQTHANPPSRGDLAFRLLTLLYTVCLGNKKRIAATLLLAVYLLGPHHIPVFGFLIAPLSHAGLSLLSWCLHTLVVNRLLRAAGIDPSVAVCDSRLYDGGGSPYVHFHEYAYGRKEYLDVLKADGWEVENGWDGDRPLIRLSMASTEGSPSSSSSFFSSSNGATLIQARRDLVADYESLITVLRTSNPITPNDDDDLIRLAEEELGRQLRLSLDGLDGARTVLGRELVVVADAASDARRQLLFLQPVCRPACYLARLDWARFRECARHSLGVQLAGRFRMATCGESGKKKKKEEEEESCIRDPWDVIVTMLERMLGAWQNGTTALRASDVGLLNIRPRIDAMLLQQIQQEFLPLPEEQTTCAAAGTTSGERGKEAGDGGNAGNGMCDAAAGKARAKAKAKANRAQARVKFAYEHLGLLVDKHCTQLCNLLSSDATALPLPNACTRYQHEDDGDDLPGQNNHRNNNDGDNLHQRWRDDAQELLDRASKARAAQYKGLVAWRVDGRDVVQALASVEVLARVAEIKARG